MPNSRPAYPEDFRREAVELVRGGRSVKDLAKSLGCSEQALFTWMKRYQLDHGELDDGLTSDEREELRLLRRKVRRLEEEKEILKRATALFVRGARDPVSIYRHISAERAHSAKVSLMCELLGVSESGYHAWVRRAPSDRALTDAWLLSKIKQIQVENRHIYGSPRIHAELQMAHGIHVSRKRVERLMRQAGISGLVAKKRGRTTIRVPGVRVADDLVERRFLPPAPNVLWIADVTYLRTWEGWLYLAAVQDAYSRRIVGWQMADHMQAELVVDALKMAIQRRRPEPGLIPHSDQGSQYVSLAFGPQPGTQSEPRGCAVSDRLTALASWRPGLAV